MRIRQTCAFAALAVLALAAIDTTRAQQIVIESTVGEPMMMPGLGGRGRVKTGTGRITGRVVSADTGAPLRRAQVRLTGPDVGVKVAVTDAEGKFEFLDLPAGRFNIQATKPGYASVQYGQLRPFEQGRPIELVDKQTLEKADISMPRGGVISGRIVDEFGEPLAEATVMAMRLTWSNGRRRPVPTGRSAQTNDLGQFRMYGLAPGEYYVSGMLRNAEFVAIERLAGPVTEGMAQPPGSGYATTYFPGTTTVANAQRVPVLPGQEAQNTDFALAAVRFVRLSGIVMTSDGKPLEGARVNAQPANGGAEIQLPMMNGSSRTGKDGAFAISSIAPGDYILKVQPLRITMSEAGGNAMMFTTRVMGGPGLGNADAETAAMPVTVSGEDISNLVIVTSKGAVASGRVVFDGAQAPASQSGIAVSAVAAAADSPLPAGGSQTNADGTFEIRGMAGRSLLRAANLPPGWMLKAIRLNADDVTDTGVDFKPGQDVSGFEIVLTSKLTNVAGTVTTAKGTAVKDCTVVLFAEDPQLWTVPGTRWVTAVRADQDGRFRFRNVPPGSYFAVALDAIEQGAWGDPELLERLRAQAKRTTIGDGQSATLDLKLAEQQY